MAPPVHVQSVTIGPEATHDCRRDFSLARRGEPGSDLPLRGRRAEGDVKCLRSAGAQAERRLPSWLGDGRRAAWTAVCAERLKVEPTVVRSQLPRSAPARVVSLPSRTDFTA